MDFEDWFEEVLELAETERQRYLIASAPFMYEDYFEQGLSPQLALESEWGR